MRINRQVLTYLVDKQIFNDSPEVFDSDSFLSFHNFIRSVIINVRWTLLLQCKFDYRVE